MSTYPAGYYDDEDEFAAMEADSNIGELVREFDVDELLAEEGIALNDEFGDGVGAQLFDFNPVGRELFVSEDMAAKLALENQDVLMEELGEKIEIDDSIQDAVSTALRDDLSFCDDETIDSVHDALVNIIALRAYDTAMYEMGGFLPDTENDWVDMVAQVKENQALGKAEAIAEVLQHDFHSTDVVIEDFGMAGDKVAWCHGAQMRAVLDYMMYRNMHDQEQITEVFKILSMLGDLAQQIHANEVSEFEDRKNLVLRMKQDDDAALKDTYSVLEGHGEIVKAIFNFSVKS